MVRVVLSCMWASSCGCVPGDFAGCGDGIRAAWSSKQSAAGRSDRCGECDHRGLYCKELREARCHPERGKAIIRALQADEEFRGKEQERIATEQMMANFCLPLEQVPNLLDESLGLVQEYLPQAAAMIGTTLPMDIW